MEKEDKFWLSVVTVISTSFLILASILVFTSYSKQLRMAELGYQETVQFGTSQVLYQKVK